MIADLRREKKTVRGIAEALGRSAATVSRELRRNVAAYRALLRLDPEATASPAALRWCYANEMLVRTQIARRPHRRGEHRAARNASSPGSATTSPAAPGPCATSPAPTELLRLIVAGRNGQANEQLCAERIRAWLEAHHGTAPAHTPQLAGAGGL